MTNKNCGNPRDYPLITIGITSFNSINTIERAILSAKNQDWPNKEILIVDDGSSSTSADFLYTVLRGESEVQLYFHKRNKGVGAARNTILSKANGEMIVFFDDDDESHPLRIKKQYARILEVENLMSLDLVASFTARKQLFPNGKQRIEHTLGTSKMPKAYGENLVELILNGRPLRGENGSCATCSMMARISTFDSVGGFDSNLRRGEDTDFNLRLGIAGGVIAGVAEPLVTQYIIPAPYKSIKEEKRNELSRLNKYRDYLEIYSNFTFALDWANVKFLIFEVSRVKALPSILKLFLRYPLKSTRRLLWAFKNRAKGPTQN